VPTVAIRLLERIADLVRVMDSKEGREHLMRHAELIAAAACGSTSDKGDEESIKTRLAELKNQFKKPVKASKGGKK
jgi:uncharacterized membrane protein